MRSRAWEMLMHDVVKYQTEEIAVEKEGARMDKVTSDHYCLSCKWREGRPSVRVILALYACSFPSELFQSAKL